MDLNLPQTSDYKIVMAFDFGLKKIGLAVGQTLTKTAQPIHVFKAKDGSPNWESISEHIKQWKPDILIVGLPLNMDSTQSEMSSLAEKFANKLRGRFGLPVMTFDERLSTFEAKVKLEESPTKNSRDVDAVAAKLILESWLNSDR